MIAAARKRFFGALALYGAWLAFLVTMAVASGIAPRPTEARPAAVEATVPR